MMFDNIPTFLKLFVCKQFASLNNDSILFTQEYSLSFKQSIQHLEEQMNDILKNIASLLPQLYARSRFQVDDFLAILQGIAGFASGIASRDPFTVIDSVIGLAGATYSLVGNTCFQSLQSYMGSVKRWLTFGQHYKPLADSSDLDFDQLDVGSVPQIMQVC